MKYVIDSSAWIELFLGSAEGKKAAKVIKNPKNVIITSDVTFGEIYSWAMKNGFDAGKLMGCIRQNSEVFETYVNIWIEAADLRDRRREKAKKFSLIDAIIYRISQMTKARLVTKDKDFKGLKNVILL
ncbi:PIN domain-containing protein [Candidatus Woesearchaeota archaeon]|nr:PIN domain-containing protein [Candidatus Woesearchaeota archaeon]